MKKSRARKLPTTPERLEKTPEIISTTGFVDMFKRIHDTMPNRQFAFLLGAGASKSSGIKLANEMVADWTTILYRQSIHDPQLSETEWATESNLKVEGFDADNPAKSYPAFYRRMFESDPDQGYAYLESQMAKAEPSYGYSVLARILGKMRHRVVVTVNFDNLVADSLSIFSDTYPLVCGHESLAQFAQVDLRRPLVLKVHRDLLLHPMSAPEDLSHPKPAFAQAIIKLLQRYTPIVIGYGGNDESLMQCLASMPANKIPGGVYWCYRGKEGLPSKQILDFVRKQKGKLVSIIGFDELMLVLGGELGLGNPAEVIQTRAKKRIEQLEYQLKLFEENAEQSASKAFVSTEKWPEFFKRENSRWLSHVIGENIFLPEIDKPQRSNSLRASKHWLNHVIGAKQSSTEIDKVVGELEKLKGENQSGKRWWQWEREAASEKDVNQRNAVYLVALNSIPNSPELMNAYATFLTKVRKDHDTAQEYFENSIRLAPMHVSSLGNYANFLTTVRNEHDRAETLYKLAIDADPSNGINLANYATFLRTVKKDNDAAENMFKRAVDADPHNATILDKYADFLKQVVKDYESAESMYKRAIVADPSNATCLGNYATFLMECRSDCNSAELIFKLAIGADPLNPTNLANYATFLTQAKQENDEAEQLYKRAIDADPLNATALGNYATLLSEIRKDHDSAEIMFKRAIDAEPMNFSNLGNYASFLFTVRNDYELAETFYQRAIDADPWEPTNLRNYATFLMTVRKDETAAEGFYERSIDADPTHVNTLGNYSRILLAKGNLPKGLEVLDKALCNVPSLVPSKLAIELWMYAYCCHTDVIKDEALHKLFQFVHNSSERTGDWDFSGVISQAEKTKHSESIWLPKLAMVLSGNADALILEKWEKWQLAGKSI